VKLFSRWPLGYLAPYVAIGLVLASWRLMPQNDCGKMTLSQSFHLGISAAQ
jgi:hypothetical protein